jgi:hypothetical protein
MKAVLHFHLKFTWPALLSQDISTIKLVPATKENLLSFRPVMLGLEVGRQNLVIILPF